MTGGCWSLLEFGQELAEACLGLLESLECYVSGSCWSLLEVSEGAGTGPVILALEHTPIIPKYLNHTLQMHYTHSLVNILL